jgi:hypothetical protein
MWGIHPSILRRRRNMEGMPLRPLGQTRAEYTVRLSFDRYRNWACFRAGDRPLVGDSRFHRSPPRDTEIEARYRVDVPDGQVSSSTTAKEPSRTRSRRLGAVSAHRRRREAFLRDRRARTQQRYVQFRDVLSNGNTS